jgi:predicted Zn-dependent peptidase
MITDCLDLISSRQLDIEKAMGNHTEMKPVFTDEQTVQSVSLDDLKKTLN